MLPRSTVPKEYYDWVALITEGILGGDIRTARYSKDLIVQPSRVLEELVLNIPNQAVRLMNLSRVYLDSHSWPHLSLYIDQLAWHMFYTALPFFNPEMAKYDPGLQSHLDQMESRYKTSYDEAQRALDRLEKEWLPTVWVRSTTDSSADYLPKHIVKRAARERLIDSVPGGSYVWHGPMRLIEIMPHTSLMSMEPTVFFTNEAYIMVGKYKFKVWVDRKSVKFLSLAKPGDKVRTFGVLDWYGVGRSQGHYTDPNLYDIPSEAFAIRVFEAGSDVYGLSIDAKLPLLVQWVQPDGQRYSTDDFHYSGRAKSDESRPGYYRNSAKLNSPHNPSQPNPQKPFERMILQNDGSLAPGVFEARNALLWLTQFKEAGWRGARISSDDGATSDLIAIEDAIFAASKGIVGGWEKDTSKQLYWLNDHRVRRIGGEQDITGSLNPIIPFSGTVFLWFGGSILQLWVEAGRMHLQEMNVAKGIPSVFPLEEAAEIKFKSTAAVVQVFPIAKGNYGLLVKPVHGESVLLEWEMPKSDQYGGAQNASAAGMWGYAAFLGVLSMANVILHLIPDLFAWIPLGSTVLVIVLAFIFPDGTIAWTREGKTEIDPEYNHLPSLIRRWIDVEEAFHRWSTRQRVLALLNRPWRWEGAITLVALPLKLIEEGLAKSVALAAFTLSSVWSIKQIATRRASSAMPLETAA